MKPISITAILILISLLAMAAMAGFFYAYSISVMWGLDASPSRSAIEAMQGINREVRNFWFAIGFMGAPVITAIATMACFATQTREAATWTALALILYGVGVMAITSRLHVPMNNQLALVDTDQAQDQLQQIWQAYSTKWTLWNHARMATSIVCVACVAMAFRAQGRPSGAET